MNINDAKQKKKDAVRTEVAQMNARAVATKLQDFEVRLAAQDKLIAHLQSQVIAFENRLNIQMNIGARASKLGSGPTA